MSTVSNKYRGNLAAERARRGLSKRQLGAIVGVHGNTVNAWENGVQAPSSESLAVLMRLYDCADPNYLLEQTGRMEVSTS